MSAQEIIEQIKALPPKDRTAVVKFALNVSVRQNEIRYATAEVAKVTGDAVVKQFDSVFRKLAQ